MDKTLEAWQDKVMYLAMIDRFFNGDKSNDDFGRGEYDPENDDCFQGGDLAGVEKKLPHLQKLGVDALWITPPVHNQWINPYIPVRGYHGYWAYDFDSVDPHFGTVESYKRLVDKAHGRGMKVIQDIVVNHTGNFFTVDEKSFDPKRPEAGWKEAKGSYPTKAPKDPVFRLNNPNRKADREAGVYNFTPNITDFRSREQTLKWALGDLDDVNLESPKAAARMQEIYRDWIDKVGIDGYRVDTVYYTPEAFYRGFLHDARGVKSHAASRGKNDFIVFGEAWSYDYDAIGRYLEGADGPRLDSAIDLPLQEILGDVFFKGAATRLLEKPLKARRRNRNLWINFLDNHDTERIDARASEAAVDQSFVALMTLPGIPCLYYGTEAGLKGARENMFARSRWNEKSPRFKFIQSLIRLRKATPALRRGTLKVERSSHAAGVLAYSMTYRGDVVKIVFNTAPERVAFDPGQAGGKREILLASERKHSIRRPMVLPPQSYLVYREAPSRAGGAPAAEISSGSSRKGKDSRDDTPLVRIAKTPTRSLKGSEAIRFRVDPKAPIASLYLLPDGSVDRKLKVPAPRSGKFDLETAAIGNGKHEIRFLAKTRGGKLSLSDPATITIRNPYKRIDGAVVTEKGSAGIGVRLHAPADPSYGSQMSIEDVEVLSNGRDLRLALKMGSVTDDWNPPHGYDHVYFNVFFDFPGRPGKKIFPKLNHRPLGFEFNEGYLVFGWGARSFGAADSSETEYGSPLAGVVEQKADAKRSTVTLTFPGRAVDGMKIFISTWDGYLGEFRGIANKKEDWEFYTLEDRNPAALSKIFDHALVTL
jgi:glycosidase